MLRITLSSFTGLLGLGSLGYGGAAAMSSGMGRTALLAGLAMLFVALVIQWRRMLTQTLMSVTGADPSSVATKSPKLAIEWPRTPSTAPHKPSGPPVQGHRIMEPIRPCSVSCLPKRKTEKWFAH